MPIPKNSTGKSRQPHRRIKNIREKELKLKAKLVQTPFARERAEQGEVRFMKILREESAKLRIAQPVPLVFVSDIRQAQEILGKSLLAEIVRSGRRPKYIERLNDEKNVSFVPVQGSHCIVFVGEKASNAELRRVAGAILEDPSGVSEFYRLQERARKKIHGRGEKK